MVAYSFNSRFIDPIDSGRKRQTIRAIGARHHAKAGSALQLYTGMRTKACRLIGRAVCASAQPITLDFKRARYILGSELDPRAKGQILSNDRDVQAFAQADGFADWWGLVDFWRAEHPAEFKAGRFEGLLITWTDYRSAR